MPILTPGDRAPDFTLPDIRGGLRCLADFLSVLPVWLIVVKSSCPTCRMVAPLAERAYRASAGVPYSVVLIAQDPPDEARNFAGGLGLTMPVLAEEAPWPVSRALGLSFVPTFFVIDPGGVISMSAEGFLRSDWEAAAGKLVKPRGFFLVQPGEDIPILRPG